MGSMMSGGANQMMQPGLEQLKQLMAARSGENQLQLPQAQSMGQGFLGAPVTASPMGAAPPMGGIAPMDNAMPRGDVSSGGGSRRGSMRKQRRNNRIKRNNKNTEARGPLAPGTPYGGPEMPDGPRPEMGQQLGSMMRMF